MQPIRLPSGHTLAFTTAGTLLFPPSPHIPAGVQEAFWGEFSPSGAVGAKAIDALGTGELDLAGAPELLSGDLGAYTASISGGRLTFTGAEGAPHGCTYRCEVVGGGSVDMLVQVVPGARTAGNQDELTAITGPTVAAAQMSGRHILIRPGRYGTLGGFRHFTNTTAPCVLRPTHVNARPSFQNVIFNTNVAEDTLGGIMFQDLEFYFVQDPNAFQYSGPWSPTSIVSASDARIEDVEFLRCEIHSDLQTSREVDGPAQYTVGIFLAGKRNHIRHCKIHNVLDALVFGVEDGICEWNDIYNIWCDWIRIGGGAIRATIRNNILRDWIGMGRIFHPDFFQFTSPTIYRDVVIEGNRAFYGDHWSRCKVTAYGTAETDIALGVNTQLTVSDHGGASIVATANDLVFTLPPVAEAAGHCFRFRWGNRTNISIAAHGSDQHATEALPFTLSWGKFAQTWGVYSDGIVWRNLPAGFRDGNNYVATPRAGVPQDLGRINIFRTSSPYTYTLPDVTADVGARTTIGVELAIGAPAVTVVAAPGQVIHNATTGENVAEILLSDERDGWGLEQDPSNNRWLARRSVPGSVVGIFGNAYDIEGVTVRGNLFWCANWGFNIETDMRRCAIYNNTWINQVHPVPERNQPWPVPWARPALLPRPTADADAEDFFVVRNAIGGTILSAVNPVPRLEDNYLADDTTTPDAPNTARIAAWQVDNREQCYPTTLAEAMAWARPRPGGPLVSGPHLIGALGVTDAEDWWDFETGVQRGAI